MSAPGLVVPGGRGSTEAIGLLQREGLIEAETNHRARVAELSPEVVERSASPSC